MKTKESIFLTGGKSVVLAVFLLCFSVTTILFMEPLYRWDLKRENLSETTGYQEEEILRNYRALISYNSLTGEEKLTFPTLPMSESAEIHFREVKTIFIGIQVAGLITFVLTLWILVSMVRGTKTRAFGFAAGLLIGAGGILLALMAWDWERVFVTFHELVFQNDYWLFDPATDPIIDLLPDVYFEHCAVGIIGLLLTGCFLYLLIDRKVKKRLYEKRNGCL